MGFTDKVLVISPGEPNKEKLITLFTTGQKTFLTVLDEDRKSITVELNGLRDHNITTSSDKLTIAHMFNTRVRYRGRHFPASVQHLVSQETTTGIITFEMYPYDNMSE
jgi:hypothetical protein